VNLTTAGATVRLPELEWRRAMTRIELLRQFDSLEYAASKLILNPRASNLLLELARKLFIKEMYVSRTDMYRNYRFWYFFCLERLNAWLDNPGETWFDLRVLGRRYLEEPAQVATWDATEAALLTIPLYWRPTRADVEAVVRRVPPRRPGPPRAPDRGCCYGCCGAPLVRPDAPDAPAAASAAAETGATESLATPDSTGVTTDLETDRRILLEAKWRETPGRV
jgi:hypothetical protein